MFKDSAHGAGDSVRDGQQFQRTDSAGLVFEVVETITSYGLPHIRVRRVDDPTDLRVFARSALMDRRLFRVVRDKDLPHRSSSNRVRLSPTLTAGLP